MKIAQRFCVVSAILLLATLGLEAGAAAGELNAAIAAGDAPRLQKAIAGGADVNEDGPNGTPLHEAIMYGSLEMVTALVDAGANLEAETLAGNERPLHVAAIANQPAIIAFLVKKGAGLETRDAQGRTPLLMAVGHERAEATTALLDGGADARAADGIYGDTPLHFSATTGNVAIAKLLLARKIDIDPLSAAGDSPLHYAAMDDRTDMVRFLAAKGANLDLKNGKGLTPLAQARGQDTKEVLLELGAKP